MNFMDVLTIISLFAGIASIVLALVSIKSASHSEQRSQQNFEKTQQMMNEIYDKMKDLLHSIDTKSSSISVMVEKNQTQLTTLFANVLDKALPSHDKEISKMSPEDIDKITEENNIFDSNKLAMQLLPELIKNPNSLEKLVNISEKISKHKNKK